MTRGGLPHPPQRHRVKRSVDPPQRHQRYRAQLTEVGLIRVTKVGRGSGNSTNYVLSETPEKGAEIPPKETIVGWKKQGNKQEPPNVKTSGFSPEFERRQTNDYQAKLADGQARVCAQGQYQ